MIEGVLERLVDGVSEWPLSVVDEVYVFGSFARDALQPGDVDLDVEFHGDDHRWEELVIEGLSYGKDPHRVLRAAMVGRRRGVQFLFNARRRVDFDLTSLWQRDDDRAAALARLHAISADPKAGRAERHAMLPQFEGLDHWISPSVREYLIEGIDTDPAVSSVSDHAVRTLPSGSIGFGDCRPVLCWIPACNAPRRTARPAMPSQDPSASLDHHIDRRRQRSDSCRWASRCGVPTTPPTGTTTGPTCTACCWTRASTRMGRAPRCGSVSTAEWPTSTWTTPAARLR